MQNLFQEMVAFSLVSWQELQVIFQFILPQDTLKIHDQNKAL